MIISEPAMFLPTSSPTKFQELLEASGEAGFVETLDHPIVHVSGLPSAFPKEVVMFESGIYGQVMSLSRDLAEVVLLSNDFVSIGAKVARTNDLPKVPVDSALLGHAINPLGHSLYSSDPLPPVADYRYIHQVPGNISTRSKVTRPLETGVTVVDLMVPLGLGQRQLVVGDRQTGKTEFLLQALLSQARKGVICIYSCIGKQKTSIKSVRKFMQDNGIYDKCVIVSSDSLDPLGVIFLTPYTAMTIAEYFRDQGNDVLLILDDLTTHAKFYREISLLAGKFPGRNSYPSDIFYTHSQLLERAGSFKMGDKEVSISCLAAGETVEGDISGYIMTNLMSITDGHLYFDSDLFAEGRRPSINYFLSVTRVGRQTQTSLRWTVNRELTTLLELLEQSKTFSHFGAEINESVKTTYETGEKILSFFNQPMNMVIPLNLQLFLFAAIWSGMLNNVERDMLMELFLQTNVKRYAEKQDFRTFVDTMINNAKDFNDLLKQATTQKDTIKKFLEIRDDNSQKASK